MVTRLQVREIPNRCVRRCGHRGDSRLSKFPRGEPVLLMDLTKLGYQRQLTARGNAFTHGSLRTQDAPVERNQRQTPDLPGREKIAFPVQPSMHTVCTALRLLSFADDDAPDISCESGGWRLARGDPSGGNPGWRSQAAALFPDNRR
ncbi:hypothetical protein Bbelb_075930 [Branchiostoma belcheri]|nr:hypothetical protein Bbelb_075930 [Branchiostoma belcheri]